MTKPEHDNGKQSRHGVVALALAGLVATMLGLAFASVPLYRLFCQATGFGGVPQRADRAPNEILDRTIRIRFDANVDRSLPWTFLPGRFQRGAGARWALLHQDRVLLLQAADAGRPRERRDAGDLLRRPQDRRRRG